MTELADAHRPLVDIAVTDLVSRLHVEPTSVSLISVKAVTWPDSSLGCPQPGMGYLQVQVDGALIELSVQGTSYRYHSGGSRGPFLCESPSTRPTPTG